VREPTPDDVEEEHVVETVKILREQQKTIIVLSVASNKANGRAQFLSVFPQIKWLKESIITPIRGETDSDNAGGTSNGSGNNNRNVV